jgi:lysophospholipase L1-like esterase
MAIWIGCVCLAAGTAMASSDHGEQRRVKGADALANRRVVFLGDSITQDGRYVSYFTYYLEKYHPRTRFDILNLGLASETTSGLTEEGHPGPRPCIHERLDRVLADSHPDLIIACYGINDGIYKPASPERLKAFQDGITRFVERCRAGGATVVLVTPPAYDVFMAGGVSAAGFDYNDVLTTYSQWEMKTRPGGAQVVDLHSPMTEFMQSDHTPAHALHSGDPVHPIEFGHYLMARILLKGLGISVPKGDPDQQFPAAQADPLYQLIKQQALARGGAWLEYVGYNRLSVTHPPHTTEIDPVEKQAAETQRKIDELRERK